MSASALSSALLSFWSSLRVGRRAINCAASAHALRRRAPAAAPGWRVGIAVVAIGRGMDADEALAAAHEVEQRLAAGGRRRGISRIVEERAGRAGEEDRVVLLAGSPR